MRDPKRIDKILKKLGDIWRTNPDMRFNQMMFCILYEDKTDHFYLEDNEFEKMIDTFIDENMNKGELG